MDVDSFSNLHNKKRKHWEYAINDMLTPAAAGGVPREVLKKHAKIIQFISSIWKLAPRPVLQVKKKRLRWYDSWHTLEASDTEQYDPEGIEECETKTNKMVDY